MRTSWRRRTICSSSGQEKSTLGGGATVLIHKLHEFDVPVLALTVGQSLEGRTRALRAGANEVLNMSSGEEIVGVVSRLISE
jgi:hypothetical protein